MFPANWGWVGLYQDPLEAQRIEDANAERRRKCKEGGDCKDDEDPIQFGWDSWTSDIRVN